MTVSLTPADTRILHLHPTHRTLAATGPQLGVGRPTVKTHTEHNHKKLGAEARADAVAPVESAGLLPRERDLRS